MDYTVVSAPLSYHGLIAGAKYAVVLGQAPPAAAHYNWCIKEVSPDCNQGKFNGLTWIDESQLGDRLASNLCHRIRISGQHLFETIERLRFS